MERLKRIIELFDLPSGSLMGLYTLIIIGFSVYLIIVSKDFPATVVSTYQFVVLTFAGSKAAKTLWGKPVPGEPKS